MFGEDKRNLVIAVAAHAPGAGAQGNEEIVAIFEALDDDGDGQIDQAEFDFKKIRVMNARDRDGDGGLQRQERRQLKRRVAGGSTLGRQKRSAPGADLLMEPFELAPLGLGDAPVHTGDRQHQGGDRHRAKADQQRGHRVGGPSDHELKRKDRDGDHPHQHRLQAPAHERGEGREIPEVDLGVLPADSRERPRRADLVGQHPPDHPRHGSIGP